MSLYVEIMCDVRRQNPDRFALENLCLTDRGDNPRGYSVASAKRAAQEQGWTLRARSHAVCPNCALTTPTLDKEADHGR